MQCINAMKQYSVIQSKRIPIHMDGSGGLHTKSKKQKEKTAFPWLHGDNMSRVATIEMEMWYQGLGMLGKEWGNKLLKHIRLLMGGGDETILILFVAAVAQLFA